MSGNQATYTIKQTADKLNVSYHTVWRMVAAGDIGDSQGGKQYKDYDRHFKRGRQQDR